jgi:hypothetical protein
VEDPAFISREWGPPKSDLTGIIINMVIDDDNPILINTALLEFILKRINAGWLRKYSTALESTATVSWVNISSILITWPIF